MDELDRLIDELVRINNKIDGFTRGVVMPKDYVELYWLIVRRAQIERAIYEIEIGMRLNSGE